MKKDAKAFIEHVLECIELIEKYTANRSDEPKGPTR